MTRAAIKVLLCGEFKPQDFAFCWLAWLKDRVTVQSFDVAAESRLLRRPRLLERLLWHVAPDLLARYLSARLLAVASSFRPDLVVVVSGGLVTARAVGEMKKRGAVVFHFYNEDFFNARNTTRCLREAASAYDHFFTTKSFNVPELRALGVDRVTFVPHGYRPNCHYPVSVAAAQAVRYGSDLAFVGTWEAPRAEALEALTGFNLRIWGNGWRRTVATGGLRRCVQLEPVYCEDMSRVFNASKICLSFLRRANRDRHTSRTFEIPACGGFQLSERTGEVLSFFDEGKEIECFASIDELKDKATYYLSHDTQRRRIAASGLARVRRSPYSFTDRLQTILRHYQCVSDV